MEDFDTLQRMVMVHRPDSNMFIETGTGGGDTARWASTIFSNVITVEIMDDLYRGNVLNFWDEQIFNIEVLHGDAAEWVRDIAYRVDFPATWWLDSHDVNRVDGLRPPQETSIREELYYILASEPNHLVLIDDVRLFGTGGYPTVEWVEQEANKHDYSFEINGDIMILKKGSE